MVRAPLRLAVAALSILTILWLKRNLESIHSQWQQTRNPEYSAVAPQKAEGKEDLASYRSISLPAIANPTPEPSALPQTVVSEQTTSVPLEEDEDEDTTSGYSLGVQDVEPEDKIVVMGKLKQEDTDWVAAELPDWQHAIYTVDDPTALRRVVKNKGRESNVYLQYIVDNYDNLPSTIVFLHSDRSGWHNEFDSHDIVDSLNRLNIDFVQSNGYANLRCAESPGCPAEVQPFREPHDDTRWTENAFPVAWRELFNNTDVPGVIAAACCAQFAVSKDQVLNRPLSEYQWFHQWIMETDLPDDVSGRVMEYSWHIIFGQDPVYCPYIWQCFADVYGLQVNWF